MEIIVENEECSLALESQKNMIADLKARISVLESQLTDSTAEVIKSQQIIIDSAKTTLTQLFYYVEGVGAENYGYGYSNVLTTVKGIIDLLNSVDEAKVKKAINSYMRKSGILSHKSEVDDETDSK